MTGPPCRGHDLAFPSLKTQHAQGMGYGLEGVVKGRIDQETKCPVAATDRQRPGA